MNKSDRIRRLLAKDLSVSEIAKRLKVKPNLVHQVKWADKKKPSGKATFKSPRSKLIQSVFQTVKDIEPINWPPLQRNARKPTKLIVQPQYKDSAMKLLAELDAAERKLDLVNKPPHYTTGGVDTLDFIEAKDLNYRLGNVVKYVVRCGKKNTDPVQDLEKAMFYLKREIATRKGA